MAAKMQLAHAIIAGFHGEYAANKAKEEFQRVFRDRQAPESPAGCRVTVKERLGQLVATIDITRGVALSEMHFDLPVSPAGTAKLVALLVPLAELASKSEAERLVKQGGVEMDGGRVTDVRHEIDLRKPAEYLLRVGKKKFLRLVVG